MLRRPHALFIATTQARPLMHADSPVLTARARGPARWESSAIRFLTENKRTDALYSYHRFDTRPQRKPF